MTKKASPTAGMRRSTKSYSAGLNLPVHMLENIGHGLQLSPFLLANHPTSKAYATAAGLSVPPTHREGLGMGDLTKAVEEMREVVALGLDESGVHLGAARSSIIETKLLRGEKGPVCDIKLLGEGRECRHF
jgi:hypothetical protein